MTLTRLLRTSLSRIRCSNASNPLFTGQTSRIFGRPLVHNANFAKKTIFGRPYFAKTMLLRNTSQQNNKTGVCTPIQKGTVDESLGAARTDASALSKLTSWRLLKLIKIKSARSRLYRSRILQVNTHWKALAEIYTMHSFAPLSNLKNSVKNC